MRPSAAPPSCHGVHIATAVGTTGATALPSVFQERRHRAHWHPFPCFTLSALQRAGRALFSTSAHGPQPNPRNDEPADQLACKGPKISTGVRHHGGWHSLRLLLCFCLRRRLHVTPNAHLERIAIASLRHPGTEYQRRHPLQQPSAQLQASYCGG